MMNTNLIIGKINSFKTTKFMFNEVEKSINNGENLILLDNKNEYFKTFKEKLDNNGYNTLVLNLSDTTKSNSYNPLMLPYSYYKNGEYDKAVELVSKMSSELFFTNNPNVDPFWGIAAANYFTSLVLILFREAKSDLEVNIGSVQILLSEGEIKNSDGNTLMAEYFDKLNALDSIYVTGSSIVYAPNETRKSVISILSPKINSFCMREQLLNNLCGNQIDLSNIKDKTAIVIIGNEQLNDLSNILINQAFNSNSKFTYYLDNFDDMPYLFEFSSMLNNKLKMFVSIRNLEQLTLKYDKFIADKFENIVDDFRDLKQIPIGNNDNYPVRKDVTVKYLSFKEIMK